MRQFVTALVFVASVSVVSSVSQTPPVPPDLLVATAQRADAIGKSSAIDIGKIIADDFVWIDVNGRTRAKADLMKSIASTDNPAQGSGNSFTNAGSTHRVYGDTVIRMWETQGANKSQAMEVWMKVNGEWKMTHLQYTPLK